MMNAKFPLSNPKGHMHDFFVPEDITLTCQDCGETYPLIEVIQFLFGADAKEDVREFKES